jgi:hypothetical protein
MRQPTIAFINDTSMMESHFGCNLVCQTFREQFARTGLNLKLSLPREFKIADYEERLDQVDLLVINGEGSIHHNKRRHLVELADRFPAVLVNCVYEKNDPHPALNKFLYIATRESASCEEINCHGGRAVIVPDALFASSFLWSFPKPDPKKDFGITDNVAKNYWSFGPVKLKLERGFSIDRPKVSDYLKKLCSYRKLCIGRFHAAVACSVLEVPFATWDSNTWKTRAMMEDMGVPQFHFASFEKARAGVPDVFPEKIRSFALEARSRVADMFDQIAIIAHEQKRLREKI